MRPPQEGDNPSQGLMHLKMTRRSALAIPTSSEKLARIGNKLEMMGNAMGAAMTKSESTEPAETAQPAPGEPAEPTKPAENRYAGPIADFHTAIDLTRGIANESQRLEIRVGINRKMADANLVDYSAKLAIEKEHDELPAQHRIAMAKIEYDDGAWNAGETLIEDVIETGGIVTAEDYLYIAKTKGEQWLKGGKTDQDLDPTDDLKKANGMLTLGYKAGRDDIKPYADYAMAYFKATGDNAYSLMPRILHEDELTKYRAPHEDPQRNILPTMTDKDVKDLCEATQALAKVYSAAGQPMEARWALEDFTMLAPKTVEVAQMEARVHQQIVHDALARGTDRDLGAASASACDAIGTIRAMAEGPKKDELMAEVGIDMYQVQAYIGLCRYAETGERLPSGEWTTNAWNEAIRIPDHLLRGRAIWSFGKGLQRIHGGKIHPMYQMKAQGEIRYAHDIKNADPEDVANAYAELLRDYVSYGLLDDAKHVLSLLKPLAKGDKNVATYAQALADVAKAEAIKIRGELVKTHISYNEQEPWDASFSRTRVPIWGFIGYYKSSGNSLEQAALDFGIALDQAEAALVFYSQHERAIDVQLGGKFS